MDDQPFLIRFRQEVPTADPATLNEDYVYDEEIQANITVVGEFLWRGSKPYTNCWTSSRLVRGHYTPKNKWVSAHVVPAKSDRRSGK